MKAPLRLGAMLLACLGCLAWAQDPVTSVPVVDLAKYSGKWFEIASFPML